MRAARAYFFTHLLGIFWTVIPAHATNIHKLDISRLILIKASPVIGLQGCSLCYNKALDLEDFAAAFNRIVYCRVLLTRFHHFQAHIYSITLILPQGAAKAVTHAHEQLLIFPSHVFW